MKKDYGLAFDTAERVGAKLVLGWKGLELYEVITMLVIYRCK